MGDVIWPAEFAHDHLARPLDDLFPATFWSRFSHSLVEAASYRGKAYAAPFYIDQGVLLYRKDLLAQKHLTNPPKTWDELVTAASALLREQSVDYGFVWQGAEYEGLTCVWTEFAASAQEPGATGQVSEAESRPRVDTPQSLNALKIHAPIADQQDLPHGRDELREAQTGQAFQTGPRGHGAAFQRAWTSAYFDVTRSGDVRIHDRIGVAPLPVFAGRPGPSTTGGWSLFVNPHTKHLSQVVDFIDWLTDAPAQLTLAQYSVIPANQTVRDDQAVQHPPGCGNAKPAPFPAPTGRCTAHIRKYRYAAICIVPPAGTLPAGTREGSPSRRASSQPHRALWIREFSHHASRRRPPVLHTQ